MMNWNNAESKCTDLEQMLFSISDLTKERDIKLIVNTCLIVLDEVKALISGKCEV